MVGVEDEIAERQWHDIYRPVLGLALKPDTDDVRFDPAINLIRHLLEEGAKVPAYDPQAMEKTRAILPDVDYTTSAYEAAKGCEALVIAAEWPEFRALE
ncbi:MAG: UDP binding domain-containing protein [Candidatus Acidiferrales bacterium]